MPGTQSRPTDVFLPNWSRGCPAAFDITIISPLQHATLQGAASTQGHSLLVGVARNHCHSAGITFVPVTFEALGGMSSLATNTVASIGRLLGQQNLPVVCSNGSHSLSGGAMWLCGSTAAFLLPPNSMGWFDFLCTTFCLIVFFVQFSV